MQARETRDTETRAPPRSIEESLRRENEELRATNRELLETLNAIRRGEVDAIVVAEDDEPRVYSLEGTDRPYRVLVEKIQEGALTLTTEGIVLFANAAFARMVDRPLSAVLGTLFTEHVVPKDQGRFGLLLEDSRTAACRGEVRLCSGTGTFPVALSLTPIEMEGQTTISVVVTDRRQDYGRLRLQGRMLDSVVDAITAADPDGRIIYWNEAAERLYGWQASERVGRSVFETLQSGVPEAEARQTFEQLAAGESWSGERMARHRDGRSFPVQASHAPVYDEDGTLIAVIGTGYDISERKRAEEALHEAGERYRFALDAARFGTFDFHVDTGEIIWDEPLKAIWGLAADEDLDLAGVVSRVHPDDRDRAQRTFTAALAPDSDGTYEDDYRIILPDGSVRWTSVRGRVHFRDEDGTRTAVRVVGIEHDITGRKQAEADLALGEVHLARAQAITHVGSWAWDIVNDRLTWSDEAYRIVGLQPGEIPSPRNEDFVAFVHPDDRERVGGAVQGALADGSYNVEFRLVRRDGTEGYAHSQAAVTFADGSPVWMEGTVQDITERKRAEEALRESEEQFRALFEHSNDAIVLSDPQGGTILAANPAACRMLGRTEEELLGRGPDVMVDPDHPRAVAMLQERADGGAAHTELTYRRSDGSSFPGEVSTALFTDGRGDLQSVAIIRDISERKRAETALRENEQRYSAIFARSPFAIALTRMPEGSISDVNDAFLAISGYSKEEVIGKTTLDLGISDPESRAQLIAALNARGGSVRDFECTRTTKSGLRRSLSLNLDRIQIGGERFALTVVQDITDRKRAETALRESEERQALLAGVASLLLSAEEPQAMIDELARRALVVLDCDVFFNYLADEASGRLLLNACAGIPGEEAERIRLLDYGAAVCGCVARDGCRIVAESIPENPDPRTDLVAGYGVRAYACHPLVVEGRTIGTLSFGTKRRDAFSADDLATMKAIADLIAVAMQRIADRDALRESEARFRSVLDGSRDVIYRLNLETGRYGYISPSCEAVVGYTPDELMALDAESSRAMVHPDDRAALSAAVEEAERTGTGEAEYRQLTRDGEYRWLSNNMVLVRDDAGRPLYRTGNIRDITRRRGAEEALRRSNEELQRFAYVASHDLQEPLRSIVSFSQLLERRYKGKLDSDADDYIDFIVAGGNRMQRLITDLLQFSRVETTAKPPVPTDAGRVAADAVALFNGQIAGAGGSVTVGRLPRVMADAAQLEQVFANLIGNAIKYRREGVLLEVRISARRTDGMVEFSVADNGIGIEAEYFDRIFEMFRRLHTHDKYEGTGIGLAVVKRIVERHGGRCWLESTPGEGSTFSFTLPAA